MLQKSEKEKKIKQNKNFRSNAGKAVKIHTELSSILSYHEKKN